MFASETELSMSTGLGEQICFQEFFEGLSIADLYQETVIKVGSYHTESSVPKSPHVGVGACEQICVSVSEMGYRGGGGQIAAGG